MGPVIAILAVIGVGIFGISTQHSNMEQQNKALKAQVSALRDNQVPTVNKLDGVQIKNLAEQPENKGAGK